MTTNIHLLKSDSLHCVFNTDDFNLYKVNEYSYAILSDIIENRNVKKTADLYNIDEKVISEMLSKIGYNESTNTDHNKTDDFHHRTIDRITLHVANDCNLRCKYCYASGGGYGKTRGMMNMDTAKRFVDYCCENFKRVKHIVFFGGEPFLNHSVIEYICNRFKERFTGGEIDYLPRFGAITNGTVYSKEILSIIRNHFSFLTVSIDGPKEINDMNRINVDGKGSFDRISHFLNEIVNYSDLRIKIEATYTHQHMEHGYTREGLREFFLKEFNLDADVVDEMSLDNSEVAVKDLENPFESPWFSSILKTVTSKRHETKCQILRSTFAVSIEGDIYPCHMNVGDGMQPVTSIWQPIMDFCDVINHDATYKLKDNSVCNVCWAKNICGGCARTSFYNAEMHKYSNTPNKSQCDYFRDIVGKSLLKICEVRKNPELWNTLLAHANKSTTDN